MKKLLAFALALVLTLALAACGGKTEPSPSGTADPGVSQPSVSVIPSLPAEIESFDFSGILAGSTAQIYGAMTAEQKAAMIEAAHEDGAEVTFNADGSTTITEADGAVATQNADGTWSYRDADGTTGSLGGEWPDNEFTKLIPKPDFSIATVMTESDGLVVTFSGATAQQVKSYVEKVKGAGFTLNAEVLDQDYGGISVYSFTARNAAGYEFSISSSFGVGSMTVSKTE